MKIRNGFVSNSSSSSFVLFCSKDVWNDAVKNLSPNEKKAVEVFKEECGNIFGQDLVKLSYQNGNLSDGEIYNLEDSFRSELKSGIISKNDIYELFEFVVEFDSLLEKSANKLNEKILSHGFEC